MTYFDIIAATNKIAKQKQIHVHFRDTVTNETEFKEQIRFYDEEQDWIVPDWNEPQPITWEEVLDVMDDIITEGKLNKCKEQARKLLTESDWAATTDVQAALQNPLEWVIYRETIRRLFINPQVNPTFPNKPEVHWNI